MELTRSLGSDWATGWTFRGSIPGKGKKFFFSSKRPDRLWDPHSFLVSEYWGSFRGVIRTGFHLVSKLRMSGDTHLLPLHAVVAWTG
jgi:hypothetical protein